MRNTHTAKYSTSVKWVTCFLFLLVLNAPVYSQELTLEEYAKNPFGNVIFLRHAFAPGMDANGMPAKFKINDCSTQRNLNVSGIEQATLIGEKLSQNGIKFKNIYSSQFCRCLETAKLLNLGKVTPKVWLNSGMNGLFELEETLTKLREFLALLKNEQDLILMISHSGVISAITDVKVKSGGAVAYNIKTRSAKEILIY